MISERVRRERADRNERINETSRQKPAINARTQPGEHSIHSLQRTLGNQAVQELHRRGELDAYVTADSPVDSPDREAEQAEETERGVEEAPSSAPSGPAATVQDGETESDATTEAETETEAEPTSEEPEAGAAPATSSETAPTSPEDDPAFQEVVEQIEAVAARERTHPPAEAASAEAQAAAESPDNELTSKAAANQVAEMAQQQPPPFDKASFKQELVQKIAEVAPDTLEEADEFKDSNKLASIKGDLVNTVERETEQSQEPIEEKAKEAPDTSAVEPKPTTPLQTPDAGSPPPGIGAARATPKSKTEAQVSAPFQERRQALDQQLDEEGITEEQLESEHANEPEFTAALQTKREAQTHAAQAPAEYRQHEQSVLSNARSEAETVAETRTQSMHGERSELVDQVGDLQEQAKDEDEQKRAEIAADIQQIYERTKQGVTDRLAQLDQEAIQAFDQGAEQARKTFEDYVDERMSAYKDERYGGPGGGALWVRDLFLPLPPEVNEFYVEGRDRFLTEMDEVIDRVATIVETGLAEAKTTVADGRQEISEYVARLPESLKAVGQEAASDIQTQFDELEQTVDDKKDQLIDSLAQKYTEKLQQVDARIEELKEANRGLVEKAGDALGGVIQTITQLKDLLLGVLGKATSAIGTIIRDPIGFLGNLVDGIKQGLDNFLSHIWTHLQTGLVSWLTGTLSEAGIQLPEQFDIEGIFSLVMQILGLTYENIRAQAVKVLGEETVSALEKAFEIFQVMVSEGIAGLWTYVEEKIGDLQAMVMDKTRELIATEVIEAGIKWIIGLLGPVGAFIKACTAIYDVVTFFLQRAREVASLVDAVLDSILAIAKGNVAGAAKLVEDALAQSIPTLIGFLANLLGLGDLPKKIQGVIEAIQEPINRGIQWVLEQAKAAVGRLGSALGFGREKETEAVTEEDREIDATDHTVVAQRVVEQLRSIDASGVYQTVREQIKQRAAQLESYWSERLEPDIGVSVDIVADDQVQPDNDIDFVVVIAPNTVREEGSVDVEATTDTPADLWETIAAETMEDYLAGFQNWRRPRQGQELGQTRAVPVKLSEFSEQRNRQRATRWINASPASKQDQTKAHTYVNKKISAAAESQEEMTVHRRLREAATHIQKLYGGRSEFAIDVEHLTEVAQNPEIFPRTGISRRYSAIASRIRKGTAQTGTPEAEIASMSTAPAQKRQIARLYAEQIVDESLDEIDAPVGFIEPVEIELELITEEAHKALTKRRAAERKGSS